MFGASLFSCTKHLNPPPHILLKPEIRWSIPGREARPLMKQPRSLLITLVIYIQIGFNFLSLNSRKGHAFIVDTLTCHLVSVGVYRFS